MNGTQYLLSAICDLSSHSSQGENDGCGLNQLNIQEIVIGGLSMGGQIVMEFCRLYPERVRGVLLAATFPRAEKEEGKRNRAKMADRLLREGMETYAEEVLPKMVAPRNIYAAEPSVPITKAHWRV